MRRAAGLLATLLLVSASPAVARPGPSLLYVKPALSPLLAPTRAFPARPLLVSGTDAYRRGEYLYQDYLYDDHGADTTPGLGTSGTWTSQPLFSPAAGDVAYPAGDRYRDNAADLVELRIRPRRRAIVYRVTLNTAIARDAAVVGIGIDTDRRGTDPVAWPLGAGVSTPGLDAFITAWGTGGSVTREPSGASTALPRGAVRMNLARNQMTIRVPRAVMNPRRATWRYVAGTGLWDGTAWMTPTTGAPGVFNLAFRFAEPAGSTPGTGAGLPGYTTAPGTGSWFEDGQARDLAAGSTGDAHADVSFRALARRRTRNVHAAGRVQARILSSALGIPEGVDHAGFPEFGGSLEPYLVTLPKNYSARRATPLLFALHPSNSNYQTYNVFMPHWAAQVGAGRIVVTLLDRGLNGPDGVTGQYTGAAEANFFEVWADLRRHFAVDPRRIQLSGYSLGAYADYHLAELWPDLFASIFSVVGTAPTNGRDTELLANLRWVPILAWNQADDAIVPYLDVSATAAGLDALGLRHEQWTFPAGNHLAPALRDDWAGAATQIGRPVATRRPSRVDFGYYPSLDDRRYGLVHDHAYWVSGLRLADRQSPSPELARADVSARSLAFGVGDPAPVHYNGTGSAAGVPATIAGIRWGAGKSAPRANELVLDLVNVARIRIDAAAARLTRRSPLTVRVHSDGPARIVLAFGRRHSVLRAPAGDSVLSLP